MEILPPPLYRDVGFGGGHEGGRCHVLGGGEVDGKLFFVLLVVVLVGRVAFLAQVCEIFVHIQCVVAQDDHRYRDIGAVVGDTLAGGDDVIEDKALGDGADLFLQPVDVVELHGVAEVVDQLLQRLDLFRDSQVVLCKSPHGERSGLLHGGGHDLELMTGVSGEVTEFFVGFIGADGDDESLVGDELQVGDRVQVSGYGFLLFLGQLTSGQLDQVGTQGVLLVVHRLLQLFHLVHMVDVQMAHHVEGEIHTLLCEGGHVVHGDAALL